jgi:WD40 repeat protein
MLDEGGKIAVTSCTDRQILIFETESGKLLAKASSGEITTGMCFTDNKKHIITTSSQGVIYIFKLPENVYKILEDGDQIEL